MEPVSLYIHIPFCTRKCPYCHFYVLQKKENLQETLQRALLLEWEQKLPLLEGKVIVSIYFGGGTPSQCMSGVGALLEKIRASGCALSPDIEITIETNPEDVTRELAEEIHFLSINRASVGIQSFDDLHLKTLKRTHTAEKGIEAVFTLHGQGIENLTIDLMTELPDQTLESFQKTLHIACSLPVKHFSLYNLTIEPHTAFYRVQSALTKRLPNEQTSLLLLQEAITQFEGKGFSRYEISAFSKPGFESQHNTGYWTGRPFLGLGPSAFSYWEGKRFQNMPNLQKYAQALELGKSPISFEETLVYPQNVSELIAIHLRLLRGVDLTPFNPLPETLQTSLSSLIDKNWIIQTGSHIQLTEDGLLFFDSVASEIV